MPGGVTSGSRRNEALGRTLYFREAAGSRLVDIDGTTYIDFTGGSGASMLGHGHPRVDAAIRTALDRGTMCTAETEAHVELAERLCELIPSAESVRFASTGTEATLAALRVARGATGRDKILRFTGHYHGMHDAVLVGWTNAADPTGAAPADSAGVPEAVRDLVIAVPFNDEAAFTAAIERHGSELAAVVLEPVSYNMGCVPADPAWLRTVREQTRRHGIVLIFDEILSGFRMGIDGAQGMYGVTPDVTTLGKTLGGGWPISAVVGREDVMRVLGPGGGVPLSGTFTTHLSAVLAALAALDVMSADGFYDELNARSERFVAGLRECFEAAGIPATVQGVGARFAMYFGVTEPVRDWEGATRSNVAMSRALVREAIARGVYFADFPGRKVPMHYGIGASHSDADIDAALDALGAAAGAMDPATYETP
ncbi:MAG TPA: aspartate aminotransferase family protein [Capillimicrobium sp.]|nr:aspartate aminotransferase family protein [Capillimicrobium sp.]